MIVTGELSRVRAERWAEPGLSWGLVPTMGFLHEGHLSLVRRAREECDRVAVSIFVNPTQFGPREDLAAYPRDLERDLALLAAEKVDLVFTPGQTTMYPSGFQTWVHVDQLTRTLEGASRPSHFQGVTTIVAKLFNLFQPDRAYFGQKDAQQAAVIQRMVADLDFNVAISVCPIVREADGLAMSSRNARLGPAERRAATVLFRALNAAGELLAQGERDANRLREVMRETVSAEPLARLDYASAADPASLVELDRVETGVLLSLAAFVGPVRLIDNILVTY